MKHRIISMFTLFAGFAVILTLTLNMINGKFWLADFRVYYCAARQFIAGGQVYLVSFNEGSGFFKYSPVILNFFLPCTIFSYKIASVIHFLILGISYWYAFIVIRNLLKKYIYTMPLRKEQLLLPLAFLCIAIHFAREMYLGNINIVMLLFCCLAISDYFDGREYRGSLFLGLAILPDPVTPPAAEETMEIIVRPGCGIACRFPGSFRLPGARQSNGPFFRMVSGHFFTRQRLYRF
jgi:hypothetical protein